MSFFDDASLAFLPSGAAGKDGKAYSIKPTDGTGDFTFSRGSNLAATRVGPTGLIEKGRENLLLQSNNFGTTWFNVRSTETGGQTDKDGGSTAWLLESTDASTSYIQQNVSSSGVQTFSVIAKKGTADYIYLLVFGSNLAGQYFDLNNGTLASPVYTTIDASIEDLGNGWYRCSLFFQSNVTHVTIYPADSGTSSLSPVGSNVYIQDAQLEIGLAATDYIESEATTGKAGLLEDEPRFDYSGGATCPSLLLEPSRTNIIESSEYFQDDYWASLGIHQFDTNTTATTSPMGDYSATKIIADTSSSSSHNIYGDVLLSSGTQYAVSIFAKAAEYDYLFIRGLGLGANGGARFNISTGVVEGVTGYDSATIEDYGNGWYRCIAIGTATSATAPYYHMSSTSVWAPFAGNNSDGIYIFGAQCEAGSYATSYIPTYGSAVTRDGDRIFVRDIQDNNIITSTSGTLFFELDNYDTNAVQIDVERDDLAYAIRPVFRESVVQIYQRVNNVQTDVRLITGLATGRRKCAISWNGTSLITSVNGTSYTDTIDGSIAAELNEIESSNWNVTDLELNKMLVFPTQLTEADLNALTTL